VAWEIWKHTNDRVFNGVHPNVMSVIQTVANEYDLWCMAGASKLTYFPSRSLTPFGYFEHGVGLLVFLKT
jgi:hypothetical protein